MKRKKKILSCFLTIVLIILMPTKLFADDYLIDNGSITITYNGDEQKITQENNPDVQNKTDANPIITQDNSNGGASTSNTITVENTGDNVAKFTIHEVNFVPNNGSNSINIVGESKAEITLKGNSTIDVVDNYRGSAIHVSEGDLTITSTENGSLTVEARSTTGYNAKIGSYAAEEMSGNITIKGNATINVNDNAGSGAAIGTGSDTNLSGNITITENTHVNVNTDAESAGIGTGKNSSITEKGSVVIEGNAEVTATSKGNGAAIGTGNNGNIKGAIVIEDEAKITAESEESAAIGTGVNGNLSGKITILDEADVFAFSDGTGAGIGTGTGGNLSGSIEIKGNSLVDAVGNDKSAGIGTGKDGTIENSGKITISETADVAAFGDSDIDAESGAAIGASGEGEMKGTITISGNSIVEAITGKYAAAIGTGKDSSTSSSSAMSGKINILDNAIVITEVKTLDKVTYDKNTNKFSYSNYIMSNGIIGEGNELGHDSNRGEFVIGPNVTINKIKGSNIEELKDYINYYIDKETGEVKNITIQGSKSTDNTENKTTNDVTTNTETVEEQVETIVHKKVVNTSVKDKPIVENISDIESIETNNTNIWSLPLFIVLFACLILLRRKRLN